MGNVAVRNRVTHEDFGYLAKNTAFLTDDIVKEYFNKYVGTKEKGRIDSADFKKIFHLAFPERPQDKVNKLISEMENPEDKTIATGNMMMLLYMFSDGTASDNLEQMFNLFDDDNSGFVSVDELKELMAYFIEIGEGRNHKVDIASLIAEMFYKGDRMGDGNEKLDKEEFMRGMFAHPVTSKILKIKKIDEILKLL